MSSSSRSVALTTTPAENEAPAATSPPTGDRVRSSIRAWLAENWDPELSLLEWRRRLVSSGWIRPSWDERWYGRGLPQWADQIVHEELSAAGAVGGPIAGATTLAAVTLLTHGPDDVRSRYLGPLLTGEESWCQLFSEPAAGSDLAGLVTHAVLDGDHWVVSGQKLWSTSAHHADLAMLLARTDWDAPKHKGLTFFVLPMRQSGVEVRPLRQMNGYSSFNEVFLADAIIPATNVVGEVGAGWSVALTTLAHERRLGALSKPTFPDNRSRAVAEAAQEAEEYFETYKWYPQRAGRVDLVLEHARQAGRAEDPICRQEMARLLSMHRTAAWTAARARAAQAAGRQAGPEGSLGKLALSVVARQAARVHSLIGGPRGMLDGSQAPFDGLIAEVLVSVPGQSLAGGTDEIQRNIIAERVLGLPREPAPDAGLPFRQVQRNRTETRTGSER
jgi:alkylation response protein AidB-like acyl-CoA dehydrogenase